MNFADALNTKAAAIERPPIIPVGTYRAVVTKIPSLDKVGDGKWETLDFQLRLIEAQEDVDQDDLAKYGGLGATSIARRRFMFNSEDQAAFDRTMYDLKRFLTEHLQVSGVADASVKELLDGSVNHECMVFIQWRADKNDPEIQYAEIRKTSAVD